MFYSELLLIECSEAKPGEDVQKLLQRLRSCWGRLAVGGVVPPGHTVSDKEGPQMLTLLFTHLSEQQRASKDI